MSTRGAFEFGNGYINGLYVSTVQKDTCVHSTICSCIHCGIVATICSCMLYLYLQARIIYMYMFLCIIPFITIYPFEFFLITSTNTV